MKRKVTLCVLVFALLLTCANAMAAKIGSVTVADDDATIEADASGKSFQVTYDGQKDKEYVVMVVSDKDIGEGNLPNTDNIKNAENGTTDGIVVYMDQVKCDASNGKVTFTVRPNLSQAQKDQAYSVYISSNATSGNAMKKIGSFTADASLLGDVNDKDGVTVADAIYILKYLANKPGYDLTGMDDVADVNHKDGITVADAIYILKYLANKPGYTL